MLSSVQLSSSPRSFVTLHCGRSRLYKAAELRDHCTASSHKHLFFLQEYECALHTAS
ncbi:hypothetical protein BDA96_02G128000 [Sorghum bicolor]|uniref:Uncharacterized protein n=1 Tax=Sorghum bicolor TaxID=4558 RepID=A0A921USF2_SORBI|nr:hypothetical protein BDA96_02G128000 [Sorghum bicolor]